MTGTWKNAAGDTEIVVECREIAGGNFRTAKYRVTEKGAVTHEGTQVIGYDASKKQIRSWLFAHDGAPSAKEFQSRTRIAGSSA